MVWNSLLVVRESILKILLATCHHATNSLLIRSPARKLTKRQRHFGLYGIKRQNKYGRFPSIEFWRNSNNHLHFQFFLQFAFKLETPMKIQPQMGMKVQPLMPPKSASQHHGMHPPGMMGPPPMPPMMNGNMWEHEPYWRLKDILLINSCFKD